MAIGDTVFTEAAAAEILDRLAKGETLRGICRDDHLPGESTVRLWVIDDRNGFAARYARARDMQLETWADQINEIADDGNFDTYTDKKGQKRIDWEVVNRSKLRVDTRRWLLSKLKPEKYGERLDVKQETTVRTVSDTPEEAVEARKAWIAEHSNGHASANGKGNGSA